MATALPGGGGGGGGFVTSLATPGGLSPVLSLLVLFQISGIIGGTANAYTLDESEDDGDGEGLDQYDYIQSLMDRIRQGGDNSLIQKRGGLCIPHGRSCTSMPKFCCKPAKCRCNLFGSNCKCARPGLFSKFG